MRMIQSVAILASIGMMASAPTEFEIREMNEPRREKPKRVVKHTPHHTGRLYPHSSVRQQARYARQIASGQLRMDGITPRS